MPKVRHLFTGVKSVTFDIVKAQIMASTTLRSNNIACVALYKEFIVQTKTTGA